ncbi:MAG: tetratricopeptide repeat protein [Bacteroidota bacterium]
MRWSMDAGKSRHQGLFLTLLVVLTWMVGSGSGWGQPTTAPLEDLMMKPDITAYHFPGEKTPGELEGSDFSWRLLLDKAYLDRYLRDGRYEMANDEARRQIESNPSFQYLARTWLQKGRANLVLGRYEEARRDFNQAYLKASDEETGDDQLTAGSALFYLGLIEVVDREQPIDKGLTLVEEFATKYPDHPMQGRALELMGMIAESNGRCDKAIDYYEQATGRAEGKDLPPLRNAIARCLLSQGRYTNAASIVEEQLRMLHAPDPSDAERESGDNDWAESALIAGAIDMETGKYPEAESAFINVANNMQGAYRRRGLLGLADTYKRAHLTDSAITLYRRLIVADSNDLPGQTAEYQMALAYWESGETEQAIGMLGEIATDQKHQYNDYAMLLQGEIRYKNREYAEALRLVEQARKTARSRPLQLTAATLSGASLIALNRAAEADQVLSEAEAIIADQPAGNKVESARVRLLRGIALVRIGEQAAAITRLNACLEETSDDSTTAQAMYWLGEAYFQSRLYKAAIHALDQLVEQYPGSSQVPGALYTIGWSNFKDGNFSAAERAFSSLIKAYPLTEYAAESELRRGDALMMSGHYPEAIAAYQQAKEKQATPEEVIHANYQQALAYFRQGDISSADKTLKQFFLCHPDNDLHADALYLRAFMADKEGKSEREIDWVNSLLKTPVPDQLGAQAYNLLVTAYSRIGDRSAAAAASSILLEKYPKSSYAIDARALLEEIRKEGAGSEGPEMGMCGLRWDDSIQVRRGELYMATGNGEDAAREFRDLMGKRGTDSCSLNLWIDLAKSLLIAGEKKRAVDTLTLITEVFPRSGAAMKAASMLARIALEHNDVESALNNLQIIAGSEKSSAGEGNRILAEIYLRQGNIDSAKGSLYRNTKLSGGSREPDKAWIMLATIEKDTALTRIIDTNLRAIEQRNDSLGIRAALALASMRQASGDTAQASRLIERTVASLESDEEYSDGDRLQIARIYETLGATASAKDIYRRIIGESCDAELRSEADRRLKGLN